MTDVLPRVTILSANSIFKNTNLLHNLGLGTIPQGLEGTSHPPLKVVGITQDSKIQLTDRLS